MSSSAFVVLAGVGFMIAIGAPIYALGRWILGPIDRLAKSRNAPAHFYLADFFCLFLAVQIPLAFVYRIRGPDTEGHFWILTTITWLLAPLIWVMCARSVSRAGVTRGWQRIVFLGVVLPVVYYGALPFLMMTWVGITALFNEGFLTVLHGWRWILIWLAIAGGLVFSGFYTSWMIRNANNVSETKEVSQFE